MINFRKGWRGHLFQGRFASYPMDDAHLMAAIRYVANNPVAAKMVGGGAGVALVEREEPRHLPAPLIWLVAVVPPGGG